MNSSLDVFRHVWQEEISKDKSSQSSTDIPLTPTGDLCQIGANTKHSFETDESIPSQSIQSFNFNATVNSNCSFTIGIRTFTTTTTTTTTAATSIEPPIKKQKTTTTTTTTRTLLDELIRDIDEITDIPFFNTSLPREIALQIFEYLSLKDIYSCLQVCKAWNCLSSDELLWYNIHKQLKHSNPNPKTDQTWKEYVQETMLYNQKLIHNFRTHQCQTIKLTHYLGQVLTCVNTNQTNILAGYSTGVIRTWSIEQVLDTNESESAEILYESTENLEPSSVQSVGFLRDKIYAVHDDGLVEIWLTDRGNRPILTQQIDTLPIEKVMNDHDYLCLSNRSKFHVWNFHENSSSDYRELNFHQEFNDSIVSMCISTSHYIPISIIAGKKSFWCVSLNNLDNRLSFYSNYSSKKLPIDIHDCEPLAIIGIENELKLFDLQSARCNVLSTNYKHLPSGVQFIRAKQCPRNEFVVALQNSQINLFDRRQPYGAVQHFYNSHSTITTLQIDNWKLVSTDTRGFIRLWDRRMNSQSLWHMNPQSHPVTYCSFDEQTLICALTPLCTQPDMVNQRKSIESFISLCLFFYYRLNIVSIRMHILVIFMFVILIPMFRHNWMRI